MRAKTPFTLSLVVGLAYSLLVPGLWAKDTLQIDKALIGAKDAWRDVTMFLQDQIQNDTLSVNIAQPFAQIGGDPASGKVKDLIVDYRLNGKPYRLWLQEEFPVAFKIRLPSPDAEAPGANEQVAAMMENGLASSALRNRTPHQLGYFLLYGSTAISLAALVCAAIALAQIRQIRKRSVIPPTPR
jgi:hypothetical protein